MIMNKCFFKMFLLAKYLPISISIKNEKREKGKRNKFM